MYQHSHTDCIKSVANTIYVSMLSYRTLFNKSQSGSPGASPGCPSKDNGLHAAWGVSTIQLNGKLAVVQFNLKSEIRNLKTGI